MTRKNSPLRTPFFTDFIQRFPGLFFPLTKEILAYASTARSEYLKCQSYTILHSILLHLRSLESADQQMLQEKKQVKLILSAMQSFLKDNIKLKTHRMVEVLRCVDAYCNYLLLFKHRAPMLASYLGQPLQQLQKYATSTKRQAISAMCRVILSKINVEDVGTASETLRKSKRGKRKASSRDRKRLRQIYQYDPSKQEK